MFGGCTSSVALRLNPADPRSRSPQQSPEEIRALEAEANFTVQQAITTAVLLYLCKACLLLFLDGC